MRISMIVAVADNGVIGAQGRLPWRAPSDLKHFKRVTTGHAVIMGRKTYESLARALPERLNIILSRQADDVRKSADKENVVVVASPDEALDVARAAGMQEAFIIGGAEIYRLFEPMAMRILMTKIHLNPEGDTYFNLSQPDDWRETTRTHQPAGKDDDADMDFVTMERRT